MLLWFGPIPVLLCLRPFPWMWPAFPFPHNPMSSLPHVEGWTGIEMDTVVILCLCCFLWFEMVLWVAPFLYFFFFRLVFLATAFRFSGDTHAIAEYVASLTMEISEGWLCCDSQWQEGLLGPHRSILSGRGSLWTWRLLWRDAPQPPTFSPATH